MTTQPDPTGGDPPIRNRAVACIAAKMAQYDSFGAGPLAELRRLDPNGALAEPTLHRLLARHVADLELQQTSLSAWALVIHCVALAAPKYLLVPALKAEPKEIEQLPEFWSKESRRAQQRLGQELWGDDPKRPIYSQRRLSNLLEASADELRIVLPRAMRFLVASGRCVPVLSAADLVVSARHLDDDWARSVRHRIARGYYRAEAKAEAATNPTSPGETA